MGKIRHPRAPLNIEEIEGMISKADNPRDKALISVLYIFGVRISEALSLKGEHVGVMANGNYAFKFITLKRRLKGYQGQKLLPDRVLVASPTTKFLNYIISRMQNMHPNHYLFFGLDPVKPMTRQNANLILKRWSISPTWPHLFRDTRATRFAEIGATDQQLIHWFGWADSRPAKNYIFRNPKIIEGLADKIV